MLRFCPFQEEKSSQVPFFTSFTQPPRRVVIMNALSNVAEKEGKCLSLVYRLFQMDNHIISKGRD